MSNRKTTPDQIQFLIKFKQEYFSYFGPEKRERWAAKILIKRGILITVRQARNIWRDNERN